MKDIRIGVGVVDGGGTELAELLARICRAEESGFQSVWIPHIVGMDAMTLAALAGPETSSIEVGTAVVPTFSRHPLFAAQQALTTQVALGGRFAFGLGPSHRVLIENALGLSYEKPARHVREYVTVVKELFETGRTDFEGDTYRVKGRLNVASATPPALLIGALGPLMREIAGTLCDGTITWMTGLRTLGEQVVPGVRAAAQAAGRPAPRIVAGIPVCLTGDTAGAHRVASKIFATYASLPSYRTMLDAEGLSQPGEIALVGDEKIIEQAIRRFADAGATDFHASLFPDGANARAAIQRTHELLGELARG